MNYDLQTQQQIMNNFTNLTNLTHMNNNININNNNTNNIIKKQDLNKNIQKSSTNNNSNNNKPMTPIISTPIQLSSANGTPIHIHQPNSQLQPPSPLIKKNLNGSVGNSPKTKGNGCNVLNNINISSSATSSPYLEVIEQESISIENVIINNRNSNVHIVVKNTSFVLKVKSLDTSRINFSNCCVKAGLYYVGDPLKEVSFIQNPPITYVGSSCKNGEQFAIDIKISILSSQHQGHLFYILVTVSPEASNKNGVGSHTILSFPIRVVSKVDHIKKDPNGVCEKKQTFIDVLTDRLTTLEKIHQDQSTLLSKMLKERGIQPPLIDYSSYSQDYSEPDLMSCGFSTSPPSSPFSISDTASLSSSSTTTVSSSSTSSKKHKKHNNNSTNSSNNSSNNNINNGGTQKNTAERFLECFNKVIKVYKEDSYNRKSFELSHLISSLEYDEKNILVDLLESFTFDESSQVKQQQQQQQQQQNDNDCGDCNCESCPYKQQAEQFMLLSPVVCFQSPSIKSSSLPPQVPSPTNQIL